MPLRPRLPGWRTEKRWRSRRWSTGSLPQGTRSVATSQSQHALYVCTYMMYSECMYKDDDHLKADISMIHYPFGHWSHVLSSQKAPSPITFSLQHWPWRRSGLPWRDGVRHRGCRPVRVNHHQQEGRVQGSIQPQRVTTKRDFLLTFFEKLPYFWILVMGTIHPKGRPRA